MINHRNGVRGVLVKLHRSCCRMPNLFSARSSDTHKNGIYLRLELHAIFCLETFTENIMFIYALQRSESQCLIIIIVCIAWMCCIVKGSQCVSFVESFLRMYLRACHQATIQRTQNRIFCYCIDIFRSAGHIKQQVQLPRETAKLKLES